MQHHRSLGTTTLVALMAAHRASEPQRADAPPDARHIDRAPERPWTPEPPPSGGEGQPRA